jgi:transcriptional regulator with XRE-family HTH domain
MTFGERLKVLRGRDGRTAERLASDLGISRQWLSALENDKQRPTLRMVERIASELGVDPGDLVSHRPFDADAVLSVAVEG